MDEKIFSYEEARALIGEIQKKTAFADNRLQALRAKLQSEPDASDKARKLNEWIQTVIARWSREILEIGAMPKGLWTVDFDSGEGYYYCWSMGESDLEHFHGYEDGFRGRRPLTDVQRGLAPRYLN